MSRSLVAFFVAFGVAALVVAARTASRPRPVLVTTGEGST
jgi:hypothetical protein